MATATPGNRTRVVLTLLLSLLLGGDVALAKLLEAAGISDEFISYLHRTDARPIHFDKE